MKRVLRSLSIAALLIIFTTIPVFASALYTGNLMVSNSGTDTTDVATIFSLNSQAMIDNDVCESDFSDVSITYNDIPMIFQPGNNSTNPWCLFVPDIGSATLNYILESKGAIGGDIRYFPGTTGIMVADGMTEPSTNFAITLNNTLIDTTANSGVIISKQGALVLAVDNTTSGKINAYTTSPNVLDFEATNTDYVSCPDSNNFSFTDGSGNDLPFSITGWVKPESLGTQAYLSKLSSATTFEWQFVQTVSGNVSLGIYNTNASAYILKQGQCTLTPGNWSFIGCTYDGSETAAGIKLYLNGIEITTTTTTTLGSYAGMTNTTSLLEFGRIFSAAVPTEYFDGTMSDLKIYKNKCLTAAEILNSYNSSYITDTTNIVGWYKFIDGSGNPANSIDSATNATANTADWLTTGGYGWNLLLTKTGIASGEYDLQLSLAGGTLSLYLNGALQSSAASNTITNSSANWYFGNQNATIYIGDIAYSAAGVPVSAWKWEYGATFNDSIGGNDGTPTFRTTSTDADVSAELVSFGPVNTSDIGSFSFDTDLPDIGVPDTPPEMFTEGTYDKIPAGDSANEILDAAGIPYSLWWFPFIYFSICFIGLIVYGATQGPMAQESTNNPYDGSLLSMAIVMEVLLVVVGIMNPVPLWPAYLFPIPALAIIISRKHTSWG